MVSTNGTPRMHVRNVQQILWPHLRMDAAKLLSSFVSSIEYMKQSPLKTSHLAHSSDIDRSNDIFMVARAFNYFFLNSND